MSSRCGRIISCKQIRPLTYETWLIEGKILQQEQRKSNSDYRQNRTLEETSSFSSCTKLGPVEERISDRLKSAERPLSILTIGPGYGEAEKQLSDNFGDQIIIDTFSLTLNILEIY